MNMMKIGRAAASALALAALVSQTASATTICETEVPPSTTDNLQAMTICAATNDGKANATLFKTADGNGGNGTYHLQVDWTSGITGGDATLYLVNDTTGAILCTVVDSTLGGTPPSSDCTVTAATKQVYMYVIAH